MLVGAALGCATTPARANGRYPLATQLVRAPNDASYLALRSTFGILETFDAGTNWFWICEQAAGYLDIQDPTLAMTADGTLLVGSDTLRVTYDRGCTFGAPVFPASSVTDLAVDPARPERVVALSATKGDAGVINHLLESLDNGQTWAPLGTPITDGFIGGTLEVAPPARIYVSGRYGQGQAATLERSDDGGMTWLRQPIDAAGTAFPFIAAVDPTSADRVYVRTAGSDSDGVFVTNDAGSTWTQVFVTRGGILGFALAPDAHSVAVGGPTAGIQVASTGDHQFQPTSQVGAFCLSWSGAGLYACAKEGGDGFTLGLSTDRGVSFAKLLTLPSIVPLACPAASTTGSSCGPAWPPVAAQIGADAGADASKSGPQDPSLQPLTEQAPSSCHCNLARSSSRADFALLALLGSSAMLRRRSRR
jgi:photosystem II stability/assembly factor-like uncharacterized protein